MPTKTSIKSAAEFVREEKHELPKESEQVQFRQQACAIGLSEARQAVVKLPPPKERSTAVIHKAPRNTVVRERAPKAPKNSPRSTKRDPSD